MQVIHWEWPCHSRDTEQRKMFSYRRKKKKGIIKSKCRLYHATLLRHRCRREEVCWASPWKFTRSNSIINSIATFLQGRPAEAAKLFLARLLVSCQDGVLRGRCYCSHFTDEEMESQGLAKASLHSGLEATTCVFQTPQCPAFSKLVTRRG